MSSGELQTLICLQHEMIDGFKSRQARGERAQTSEGGVLNSDLRSQSFNYLGVSPIAWIISSLAWT